MSQDARSSVHIIDFSQVWLSAVSTYPGWVAATSSDFPRPVGRSGPGSYESHCFALGSGVCQILHVPSKSEVSLSPGPVVILKLSLPGLQSHMLWALIFLIQEFQAGEPNQGLRILTIGGELCSTVLQFVGCLLRVWDLIISWLYPSYLSHCGSFFISSSKKSFLVSSFSSVVVLQIVVTLVCSWEEVSSGSFYSTSWLLAHFLSLWYITLIRLRKTSLKLREMLLNLFKLVLN